jgi:deoxyribodipyrimidine photo-lyase
LPEELMPMTAQAHITESLIVWIRRELRVHDHLALWMAVRDAKNVVPVFILDQEFRTSAPAKRKVMLDGLDNLRSSLRKLGGELFVRSGEPGEVLHKLLLESNAGGVYLTRDYHPELRLRDERLRASVESAGKVWKEWKDHVLFEDEEILSAGNGTPFTVYTAYKRAWRARQNDIPPSLPRIRRLSTPRLSSGDLPTAHRIGGPLQQRLFPMGGEK